MPDVGSLAPPLDWNDVRFFLAVARSRTLARAAAALGVDQTTVGRRIGALESRLRVALFKRGAEGFQVSAAGQGVLRAAERMEEAALELRSQVAGERSETVATVRIATTESLAEAFVLPAVAALHQTHPRITAVVMTGWSRVDLRKGDADLAVRLARPTDPRLAGRKLAELSLRLYASRAFVEANGMPRTLSGQPLIAYEESVSQTGRHPFAHAPMDGGRLAVLGNSHHVLVCAAEQGLGIVQLPAYIGEASAKLVRVLPEVEADYTVWLVVPQANRRIAAIRAVSEAIAAAFKAARAAPTRGTRP